MQCEWTGPVFEMPIMSIYAAGDDYKGGTGKGTERSCVPMDDVVEKNIRGIQGRAQKHTKGTRGIRGPSSRKS